VYYIHRKRDESNAQDGVTVILYWATGRVPGLEVVNYGAGAALDKIDAKGYNTQPLGAT
jgi:hypothetical protein